MIQNQSSGIARRNIPVFVCDICGKPITKIGMAAAVFRGDGLGEGELYDLKHVHKGKCQDRAEAMMNGQQTGPWHEFTDHFNLLIIGLHVTVWDILNREVSLSCALNPNEEIELQKRISQLKAWLRDHGVSSPLL